MKMKSILKISILFLSLIALLPGCQSEPVQQVQASAPVTEGSGSGVVTETMNSGGYTYLLLESEGQSVWVASAEMEVKVGDTVEYMGAAPMKDFHSASLNRTFPMILFAGVAQVQGASGASDVPMGMTSAHSGGRPAMPQGHPAMPGAGGTAPKPSVERPEPGSVPVVPGGLTIAEVFADRTGLADKSIEVSGKVVKVNPNIMGKNWIHIQDGTEHEGDFDLLVTSSEVPEMGSVVTVKGKVAVDKDLGAGYFYKILVEGASFATLKQ
jgi:hypothetical protein